MTNKNIKKKRQIISVSRRTDIPAFYSKWFINRVRQGFCTVPNPFNTNQVSYVSLKPEHVTAFVFWTRNAQPIIKYIPEFDSKGYTYYFQYTVIGYPQSIDPKSPKLDSAIKSLLKLSDLIGKNRVVWRYDPIILSNITPIEWHIERLSYLFSHFRSHVRQLVISIIDPYQKIQKRLMKESKDKFKIARNAFGPKAYAEIFQYIGNEASNAGIEVVTCAEKIDLAQYNIQHGKCINDKIISEITGLNLSGKKDPYQRKECGCVVSKDIGINNTCLFGCVYCYATKSFDRARCMYREHNPSSPSLIGWFESQEKPKNEYPDLFSGQNNYIQKDTK